MTALFIHVPMFGSKHIDSRAMECAHCGSNDWIWNRGDVAESEGWEPIICICGAKHRINWPIEPPDHISTWLNGEYCPHYLCKAKFASLCEENQWRKACA